MPAADDTPQYEQFRFDYDVAASAVATLFEKQRTVQLLAKEVPRSEDATHAGITRLREIQAEARDVIEKVAAARGTAKVVAYSAPDVAAHGKDIVAAIKQIAAWERQVLKLDTAAETAIQHQFTAGLDAFVDAAQAFEAATAGLRAEMKVVNADLATIEEALKAIHEKAGRCVQAHDANGLSLAQGDAAQLAVDGLKKAVARGQAWIVQGEAQLAKLSQESRAQLRRPFNLAKGACEAAAPRVAALAVLQRDVKALKLAPLDLGKGLKTLGLAAVHKAALGKALVLPPPARAKALGELAKAAGLETDGKRLLAELQKAGVI